MDVKEAKERLKAIAIDKNAEWLGYSNINAINAVLSELEKKDKIIRAIIKAYKQDMGSTSSTKSTIEYFTNKVEREGK